MSADYVRKTYGVPAKRGMYVEQVPYNGQPPGTLCARGCIASFSNYVHVRLAGVEYPFHDGGATLPFHPHTLAYFDGPPPHNRLWPPTLKIEKLVEPESNGRVAGYYAKGHHALGAFEAALWLDFWPLSRTGRAEHRWCRMVPFSGGGSVLADAEGPGRGVFPVTVVEVEA